MKMDLRKKVNKDSIFREYVNILNGVLRLTNRGSEAFSLMLSINYDLNAGGDMKLIRPQLHRALGTSKFQVSRLLRPMKNKGILYKSGSRWYINPALVPNVDTDEVAVNYILEMTASDEGKGREMADEG